MSTAEDTGRAFVLGLDGVPWGLLERFVAAGELEHFARLFEAGAAGPLASTTPATTPLAWPSITTGTRPDRHGFYGFRHLTAEYGHRMNTADRLARPALWDVLAPAVVANVPMTYPVREIDGAMVSGMMTPASETTFAHPPALQAAIDDRIPGYEVDLDWSSYDGATDRLRADLNDLVEGRRALLELLMERRDWRLFFFVFTAPDRLQHLVWEEDVLLEHYRVFDDVLGEVMAYVEAMDATLFVVSDHGFGPIRKRVAVNAVLAEAGYLARRRPAGVRGVLARLGVTREGVLSALARVGLDAEMIDITLPGVVTDRAARALPGDHVLHDVDYAGTVAFVHDLGNVYVNDTRRFASGVVAPADVPAVRRALAALFAAVVDPDTGERVLDVADGDATFPTDPDSPDLVLEARDGYVVGTALADDPILDAGAMAGSHRPEGVFLAWGPGVAAGASPADATVYDVTPTLLHAVGEPVPAGADGRVLTEIFAPGSPPDRAAVRTRRYRRATPGEAAAESSDEVEDRLRGLGYLS